MTGPDTSTTGGAANGGAAKAATKTPAAYGHGSKESAIGAHIGAYAGEDKARAARGANRVRTVASTVAGEAPTIHGESVAQMRARTKAEREAAEPTPFQQSLIGRRPGAGGLADVSLASAGATANTGAGVASSSTTPATTGAAATTSATPTTTGTPATGTPAAPV